MDPRSSRFWRSILCDMPASPVLRTERLQLQPLSAGDLDALRALLSLEPVRRFLPDGRAPNAAWAAAVVVDSSADLRRELGFWSARTRGQDALCGLPGTATS